MRKFFPVLLLFFSSMRLQAQVKIYGTTTEGGDSAFGVLFSMYSDGSDYQVLHSFKGKNGDEDGSSPDGGVVMGFDTKLYGLTVVGGIHDQGTLYSYDTVSHIYQKLFDFDTATGYRPKGYLTFFNNKFYGLGTLGGANLLGTIFCYDPVAGTLTNVHDLTTPEGNQAFGSLTLYNNLLYFTTYTGGANNGGTLDVFDPATGAVTNLHDFPTNAGPWSGMQVKDSTLYGVVTFGGPSMLGNIFSYRPDSSLYRDIFDYNIAYDGIYPYGIAPFHTLLYVTTVNAGVHGNGGTIGYLNPKTGGYSQIHSFDRINDNIDGSYPYTPPIILPNGLLMGMTERGGTTDSGVVYSYDVYTDTYTKLVDLGGVKGAFPVLGGLFYPGSSIPLPLEVTQFTGLLTDAGRVLNWTTTLAAAGAGIQLQRSTDGKGFSSIDSAGSSAEGRYSYTDAEELPGVSVVYYRLKITHPYQEVSYSNIVVIGLKVEGDNLQLLNTMVTGNALLQYSSNDMKGSMLIRVVSLNGQVMLQRNLSFSKGMNNYSLDMQGLPQGMYVLQAGGKSIKFVRM